MEVERSNPASSVPEFFLQSFNCVSHILYRHIERWGILNFTFLQNIFNFNLKFSRSSSRQSPPTKTFSEVKKQKYVHVRKAACTRSDIRAIRTPYDIWTSVQFVLGTTFPPLNYNISRRCSRTWHFETNMFRFGTAYSIVVRSLATWGALFSYFRGG